MRLNDDEFVEHIDEMDDILTYIVHQLYNPGQVNMTKKEVKELISCIDDVVKLIKPIRKLIPTKKNLAIDKEDK